MGTRRLVKLCLWGSGGVLRDVCAGIRHNYPLGAGCDDRLPTDGNTGRFYGCCTKPTRVAATKRMNLNTLPASPFDVCCHNSIFSRQHQRGGLHSSSRLQYRLVLAATERIELKFPPFAQQTRPALRRSWSRVETRLALQYATPVSSPPTAYQNRRSTWCDGDSWKQRALHFSGRYAPVI